MNYKKAGRLTGIFFIIGTAAGVTSISFLSILNEVNYLTSILNNPSKLIIGALLVVLMGIACPLIAYSIYPVLSKYNKTLAIGAVGFRTMEGALTLLSAITLLSLLPIATEYAGANAEAVLVAGNTMLGVNEAVGSIMGIAFATGALLYSIGFFKTKLVPRWLSVWGITAASMHIIACVLVYYGFGRFSPVNMVLNIPIGLQEMVLAVYLLIFGFREVKTIA